MTCRTLAFVALVALSACTPEPLAPQPTSSHSESEANDIYPAVVDDVTRITVLGDSVTLGVNACIAEDRICAKASWASGGAEVGSLTHRVAAQNPDAQVRTLARDGVRE